MTSDPPTHEDQTPDPAPDRVPSTGSSPSARDGDKNSAEDLLPVVYSELRRLADARLRTLPPGQTLQATALVHEAYMKLVGKADPGWDSKAHFFGAAAQAMREILVDHARRKGALKRGGDRRREELTPEKAPGIDADLPWEDILALDACMDRLQWEHPRPARVVLLMYFGGLDSHQIAAALDVGERTVRRDWRFAQAWISDILSEDRV